MTALLALYGLAALASHVEAPPEVSPRHEVVATDIPAHWSALADCESGSWNADGEPIPGTARWNYGAPGGFTHEGFELYEGGLNYHPDTWTWGAEELGYADAYPHAYDAPPHVQVEVGEWVQERQGWAAWPICSRKVGLR